MKRLIYTALLTLGLSSAALAASGQDSAPPALSASPQPTARRDTTALLWISISGRSSPTGP